jgi:hypothetical protein
MSYDIERNKFHYSTIIRKQGHLDYYDLSLFVTQLKDEEKSKELLCPNGNSAFNPRNFKQVEALPLLNVRSISYLSKFLILSQKHSKTILL